MRRPVRDALALGILGFLTLGIGALDCATGRNVSLWFVYVLPICMAAAIGGLRAGLVFSVLSAIFIVEFAPASIRRLIVTIVRLLAAVPSVVSGLIGLHVSAPFLGAAPIHPHAPH